MVLISATMVALNDVQLIIACRGAEPKQLAFSTALGVTLGVFPICGKIQSMLMSVFV